MKKLIIAIISLTLGMALLRAQGLISLTSLSAGIQTNTSSYYAQDVLPFNPDSRTFSSNVVQDAYNFIVLAATVTNAVDEDNPLGPDWGAVTLEGGPVAVAMNFAAPGSVEGPSDGTGFASDLTPDTLYYIMVVGWSSNLGNWDQIQGDLADNFEGSADGFFGVSLISTIDPTATQPTAVFSSTGVPPNTMVLYSVPEPTTLALAGLGGFLLFFVRRNERNSVVLF